MEHALEPGASKTSEKDNLDKCVVTAVKDPAHLIYEVAQMLR
jgi:hypothetical protein